MILANQYGYTQHTSVSADLETKCVHIIEYLNKKIPFHSNYPYQLKINFYDVKQEMFNLYGISSYH